MATSAELDCTWEGPIWALSPAFTSTGPRGGSAKVPRHCRICLSLPLPASQLLILITKMSVSERTFDGIGKLGFLNLPWWGGAIQTSRKMVFLFHHPTATSLSLFWIISLAMAGWSSLYTDRWGLWNPEFGSAGNQEGVSIDSPIRGKHWSSSHESLEMATPQIQSWSPLDSLCCCLHSRG